MKKNIFTLCCTLFFALSLSAQQIDTLTVSNMNLPGVARVSTIAPVINTGAAPSFAPATNATWDLTNLYYGPTYTTTRLNGPSPYNFNDTVFHSVRNVNYNYNQLCYTEVSGFLEYGVQIDTQIIYPNPAAPALRVEFPTQVVSLEASYYLLPLPLTYQSSWSAQDQFRFNFNVSDSNLAVKHEAGFIIHTLSETNNVVGYGKMRVNTTDTATGTSHLGTSAYINVLQVEKVLTEIDSANIADTGGVNNLILDSLGFPSYMVGFATRYMHRDTTKVYEQLFYHTGTLTPLATVVFTDGSFNTVQSITVNTDSPSLGLGVSNVSNNTGKISVYPNPVVNDQVYVDISDAKGGLWSYDLISTTGQTVAANTISSGGGQVHAQITLSHELAAGVYYLRVKNNGVQAFVRSLEVIK